MRGASSPLGLLLCRPHRQAHRSARLSMRCVRPLLVAAVCLLFVLTAATSAVMADPSERAHPIIPMRHLQGTYPVSRLADQVQLHGDGVVEIVVYYPGYSTRLERLQRITEGPFPVAIFSPGFGADAEEYHEFLEPLCSCGCVVVGASWHYEDDREDDWVYTEHGTILDHLDEEAADWRSPLYGIPDTSLCGAFGHSRGGRTAFMASSEESRIRAVAAWMPPLDNASQVTQSIPKLLFAGGQDDVCPPNVWQESLYESAETPIVYILRHEDTHGVSTDFQGHITECFLRMHVLGDASMEPEVYGEEIKARAATGEFRLRMRTSSGEYDSAPETDVDADGANGGDAASPEWIAAALLVVIAVATVLLLRKRLTRLFGVVRRSP